MSMAFSVGGGRGLQWLFDSLKKDYDLKKHVLEPGSREEVKYLNRVIRRGPQGRERECDPKRVKTLIGEFGMEGCKGKETPITKDGQGKSFGREILGVKRASKVRRGIDLMNNVAQDRPDLAVAARALSHRMAQPSEGAEHRLKRAIRHFCVTCERGDVVPPPGFG